MSEDALYIYHVLHSGSLIDVNTDYHVYQSHSQGDEV